MRRSRKLEKLADQISRRTGRLSALAGESLARTDAAAYRTVSYITVEAMTAWDTFCREYFLSCAYLTPQSASGSVVSHTQTGVVDEATAVIRALLVLNPQFKVPPSGKIDPRREPDWRRKDVILALVGGFGFSNATTITSALSYPTTFFDELPTVRNFFAHRDAVTANQVGTIAYKKYGITKIQHPVEFVNDVLPSKSDSLIREWLSDMSSIGVDLCA